MTALSSILSSLDVFAKSTSLSDTFDGGAVPLIIALMTITNVLSTLALSHVDAIIDAVAADPKNAVDVQETCQYKDLPLVKSPQDMWVRIIGGWKFEWKANGWFLFQHGLLRQISVLVTRLQYDFRWRHDQMASAKDVKFFQPDDKIEQSLGAQFGANAVQCLIRNTYEDCHALLVEGIDGSSHSRSISPMLVSEEEGARRTGRTAKSDDMATLATTVSGPRGQVSERAESQEPGAMLANGAVLGTFELFQVELVHVELVNPMCSLHSRIAAAPLC